MRRYNIGSLLLEKPSESLFPAVDHLILVPLWMHYYAWRLLLRPIGRERRSRIQFLRNIKPSDLFVPSYEIAKVVDKISRKVLSSHRSLLIQVTERRVGYRYLCRLADFAPGREEGIIQRFIPGPGDTVIDVGAHIGRYTLRSSKLVGPTGKVIAIEAAPDNFDMLQRNMQLNNSTNVIAVNCAAFSKDVDGMHLFLQDGGQGNTIYNTVMKQRAINQASVTIPALTLDTIVRNAGISEVNWIKIDVEGAEYEVLKGAGDILANSKSLALLVEVHNLGDGTLYDQIIEALEKNGFGVTHEVVHQGGERHVIFKKQ